MLDIILSHVVLYNIWISCVIINRMIEAMMQMISKLEEGHNFKPAMSLIRRIKGTRSELRAL